MFYTIEVILSVSAFEVLNARYPELIFISHLHIVIFFGSVLAYRLDSHSVAIFLVLQCMLD